MLKTLVKISNKLDSLGLIREADLLDQILRKLAVPIEGIVEMRKYEPLGSEFTEEDEEGNFISRPVERLERKRNVLRDRRGREELESYMERKNPTPAEREEMEKRELEEWYGSLKELGDSIILIPFDKSNLDHNEEVLMGLAAIFGSPNYKNYKDLFSKINLLSGSSSYKQGNLEVLKEVFPSLWIEISEILRSKKLNEEDVIYMFYNQENSPERSLFTKNPFYLAHDLGHSIFDSEDADWEFKGILRMFLNKILDLYLSEDGETALEAIGEENFEDDYIVGLNLGNFFHATSDVNDIFGDIFADVTSGNIQKRIIDVPDFIYYDGEEYKLSSDKKSQAVALLKDCIDKLKKYVNPNVDYGTFAPGPLSYFAGSVVLQDV